MEAALGVACWGGIYICGLFVCMAVNVAYWYGLLAWLVSMACKCGLLLLVSVALKCSL